MSEPVWNRIFFFVRLSLFHSFSFMQWSMYLNRKNHPNLKMHNNIADGSFNAGKTKTTDKTLTDREEREKNNHFLFLSSSVFLYIILFKCFGIVYVFLWLWKPIFHYQDSKVILWCCLQALKAFKAAAMLQYIHA